ncbi:30S ribosomal protein S7 [Candidatus Absconditicoccus praedator]|uniref:30S ribosomal protein S7 n=1 Tax=Candidatus Absconditicoccus praedator TaxID=2735562 RepID=UPI001E58520B|nr:30S ribosomal protein S7 [Candidatus Absconditicoccus praedator]UFX83199.1 30S ribosomal protein S7 [Candidatus Absconditicoccus praedator]
MAKKFKKNELFSTPSTNSKIEKFVNHLMKDGKKSIARKIFYDCMEEIKKNGHINPFAVWEIAIENSSPSVMVKSKRIGGAVYQVPLEVKSDKKFFYAVRWILMYSRQKKGVPMYKALAEELLAAYSNQGSSVKRKEDTHKMAEANKAYAYLAKYVK